MTDPIPVILDVDTGVDDAFALLFAARHPGLDLRAVTCVAGNTDVDSVVANTLTVLTAAGVADVPVARGAERPLLEPARPARHVHGEDGMGDLGRPASSAHPDPRHAVELLHDLLTSTDRPITLITLGPMTNAALLLRTHPDAVRGIERLVFMGGGALRGNATAAAEFNVWHDPEATAIVLDVAAVNELPVTMYGLDVFYGPEVSRAQSEALPVDDPGARLAADLLRFSYARYGSDLATIGDAGAVCAVVDPAGIATTRLPVRVELAGTWTRGQTVVDRRTWSGDHGNDEHGLAPALVDVALEVDAGRYVDLWLRTMSG
ncbi:MAG: nucleoside hydrolase [Jatrophihabitans sp.]